MQPVSEAGVVMEQGRGLSGDGVEEWELQKLSRVLAAEPTSTCKHERATQG